MGALSAISGRQRQSTVTPFPVDAQFINSALIPQKAVRVATILLLLIIIIII